MKALWIVFFTGILIFLMGVPAFFHDVECEYVPKLLIGSLFVAVSSFWLLLTRSPK